MKYFKKFFILGLFSLFWVSFTYWVFNPSVTITNSWNLVNSQCTWFIALSNFIQNTNWVAVFNDSFFNWSDCDRLIDSSNNVLNSSAIVCTYLRRSNSNSSSTATLVWNAIWNLYWNIENAWSTYVQVNSSQCVFVRTWQKLEVWYANNLSLSAISGWFFWFTIVDFNIANSYFDYSVSCPSCPSCPNQYTSLECQTEYNLIPISEVTKNYCEINFDLIDPIDCPSSPSSWSWDVQRSALYVNNVQYNGAPNLYVNINDLLDYSMTYVEWSAVIDVDWYKADTWYMNNILTIQEYHPSSEDFTIAFVSFMTLALPYVIVILFVVFVRKLIRKIFKS